MRCSAYAAVGLALVFVWSSLNDHMFSLHDSMPEFLNVNPRLFFLAGILAPCIAFVAVPRQLRVKDASFEVLLPLIGAMGTICIAIAPYQNLFNAGALCVIGLAAVGVGYCWLVVRYGLLLARGKSIARIVYCLASAQRDYAESEGEVADEKTEGVRESGGLSLARCERSAA